MLGNGWMQRQMVCEMRAGAMRDRATADRAQGAGTSVTSRRVTVERVTVERVTVERVMEERHWHRADRPAREHKSRASPRRPEPQVEPEDQTRRAGSPKRAAGATGLTGPT